MKRLLVITLAILLGVGTAFAGYEDFNTFTLVDDHAPDRVTVDSATKVSVASGRSRDRTFILYIDKNAVHFNSDFTHQFEIQFDNAGNTCTLLYWMLANIIGDRFDVQGGSEDAVWFQEDDDTENLGLFVCEDGTPSSDKWLTPGPQPATTYFITITYDRDGGVNNTGQYVAYIRTGSHAGVLKDTLTKDCSVGEQNDFRYLYAVASRDDENNNRTVDGFTENMDLNEVVGLSIPIADYHYRHH